MPESVFFSRASAGDLSFLTRPGETEAQALFALGPGYLSSAAFLLEKGGDTEAAAFLYERAFDFESGYPKKLAADHLIALQSKAKAWRAVYALTEARIALFGDDAASLRAALEAARGLGFFEELLVKLASYRALYPLEAGREKERLAFYEAQAAIELGIPGGIVALRAFFRNSDGSQAMPEAIDFIASLDPDVRASFSDKERLAWRGRAFVAQRDYSRAYQCFKAAGKAIFSATVSTEVLADAGKAWLYSSMADEGMALFEAFLETLPETARSGGQRFTATFYLSRFWRETKAFDRAAAGFARAADLAPTAFDRDAALWYRLDSLKKALDAAEEAIVAAKSAKALAKARKTIQAGQEALALALETAAKTWNDASYFYDFLDPYLVRTIRNRDWKTIERLQRSVAPYATGGMRARISYIYGRLVELGFIKTENADAIASKAFEAALSADGSFLYYRVLASRRLGLASLPGYPHATVGRSLDDTVPVESSVTIDSSAFKELELDEAAWIGSMIAFGLGEDAARYIISRSSVLSVSSARVAAASLAAVGEWAASMRIALSLDAFQGYAPSREDLEALYPRAFAGVVEDVAAERSLPPELFFGLIRSESFFRPWIGSSAGAIGLSQLMPATAAEVAASMDLERYDLQDPHDNLRIGGKHFADLLSFLDPLLAMAAYNAGLSRARKWRAEGEDLPDDLLLESFHIEETRQYGRNILGATVFYAMLYYGKTMGEAVDAIFTFDRPQLKP